MTQRVFVARVSFLSDQQHGFCHHCAEQTWIKGAESRPDARKRLGIVEGVPGSGKLLTARRAGMDRTDDGRLVMCCQGCREKRNAERQSREAQAA